MKAPPALLEVRNLTIRYHGMTEPAVRDVSFAMAEGERVGLVGESGSGKSTLALALSRLLPESARQVTGQVAYRGVDIATLSREQLRQTRGSDIARVPQDSLAGLNPVITVGHQLRDAVRAHRRIPRDAERQEIVELLRSMNMPDVETKLRSYPHELSGGMRQRVLIAMALVNKPAVLVADEPTTALDATVQAQLLDVLRALTASRGSALLLVSHDINVVSAVCTRTLVMYRGEIVEDAPTRELVTDPWHPYTAALIAARDTRHSAHLTPDQRASDVKDASACTYGPRCPLLFAACTEHPALESTGARRVRCFRRSEQ